MKKILRKIFPLFVLTALSVSPLSYAFGQHIFPEDAGRYTHPIPGEKAIGRWDITIQNKDGSETASWLEIEKSGIGALVGSFVGAGGSARPVSEVRYDSMAEIYSFTIPPQWGSQYLHAEFMLKGGKLKGEINFVGGDSSQFTAVRAPLLTRTKPVIWGNPIHLLKSGLSDWIVTDKFWKVENGVLIHTGNGGNLITKQKFSDFKLHVEFRYSAGANSGIYLRGRYEVQVLDSYGMHTGNEMLGGIYGFISPVENMAKKPGEWQTYDITLKGRLVTVVLNGKKIICNRPFPELPVGRWTAMKVSQARLCFRAMKVENLNSEILSLPRRNNS